MLETDLHLVGSRKQRARTESVMIHVVPVRLRAGRGRPKPPSQFGNLVAVLGQQVPDSDGLAALDCGHLASQRRRLRHIAAADVLANSDRAMIHAKLRVLP